MRLRIRVRDANDRPAAGLRLLVEDGAALHEVTLDGGGRGEAPLAGDGPTRVSTADGALVLGGESLAAEAADTRQSLAADASLITLAAAAGLPSWRCIWQYGPNAALRALRGDPFRVQPGDEVRVPTGPAVTVPAHLRAACVAVFVLHPVDQPRLDLALVDSAGVAAALAAFRVEWDDGTACTGTTDVRGRVLAPMPRSTCTGTLHVMHRAFRITVAGLPPLDSLAGVQARLNHLNFPSGPTDGVPTPRTRDALASFQRVHGLPLSGEPDPATRAALERAYGA